MILKAYCDKVKSLCSASSESCRLTSSVQWNVTWTFFLSIRQRLLRHHRLKPVFRTVGLLVEILSSVRQQHGYNLALQQSLLRPRNALVRLFLSLLKYPLITDRNYCNVYSVTNARAQ